ncbi:MAG: ATP-binding cassette domain-containing protein [Clostridium sp.]|nr:ATP-binding cassette domain-containing protein [Clostridium sp.]
MEEILRIEHLTVELGGRALMHDLNASLLSGEMVGVVGESGCGKTTLLRSLLGFVSPTKGSIHIWGEQLSTDTISFIRSRISYVPQELSVPCESVGDMVEQMLGLKVNRTFAYTPERLFALWGELGLERELYSHRWTKVSGGQRQRILLSMAALTDKPLLLIDEPTAALDEENGQRVAALIRRLCREGRTTLVVSHDEQLVRACDRVIHL